ncbi:MAG: hypothetical protein EXR71_01745 [Myxococcales bacterium]|nr:hypothetical protein [Myxococcales bacterium]
MAPAGVRAAGFTETSRPSEPANAVVDEAWESRLPWTGLDWSADTEERFLDATASPSPPVAGHGPDPFALPVAKFVPRTQRPGGEDRPIPAAAWAAVGLALLIAAAGYVWYRVHPRVQGAVPVTAEPPPPVAPLLLESPAGPEPAVVPSADGASLPSLPPPPLALPAAVVEAPVGPPVRADQPASVSGTPETPMGRLHLYTDEDAHIRIDGRGRGDVTKLDDYELEVGDHTVKLTSLRTGRTLTQRVRIDTGRGSQLVFTFR